MGIDKEGNQKDSYEPGIELIGKVTVFAEGCRGHLGKQLIEKFNLSEGKDPQQYGSSKITFTQCTKYSKLIERCQKYYCHCIR